jgi:hypothetical protein
VLRTSAPLIGALGVTGPAFHTSAADLAFNGTTMDKSNSRERRVEAELERLRSQSPRWQTAESFVERFFTRLLRIVAGLALAGVAMNLFDSASSKTDIAFAALTLKDLAAVLFGSGGGLAFTVWAFQVAFGDAPQRQQRTEATLRAQAESAVYAKEREEASEATAIAQESDRVAAWYRRGRLLGMLFDPSLARKHTWLPLVAVLVAIAVLAAVIFVTNWARST